MLEKAVMSAEEIHRALVRIAYQVVERNSGCKDLVLIGVHTRGVPLAHRIAAAIEGFEHVDIPVGAIDIRLHRDDLSLLGKQPAIRASNIPTDITNKNVILIDDVLFTGRTIRAAMDALIDFGRPRRIQLAVLIDRGHRELPIRSNFVGKNIPSSKNERIMVLLKETDSKDAVLTMHTDKQQTMLVGKLGDAYEPI
ncbi:bifunctional pyr operon transcriptional regulator/uracil phosphoribosyltransferase PyrR [Chloroflexota bacterium]